MEQKIVVVIFFTHVGELGQSSITLKAARIISSFPFS